MNPARGSRKLKAQGCGSSKLDPREFVRGFDGPAIACSAWRSRQAERSRSPETANPEPAIAAEYLDPKVGRQSAYIEQVLVSRRLRSVKACRRDHPFLSV